MAVPYVVRKTFGLFAVTIGVLGTYKAANAAGECDVSPDIAIAQCLSQRIDNLKTIVTQLYNSALSGMPSNNDFDTRKSQAQLVKAQDSWRTYVQENCAYVGGLEGGGNLWVTIFSEQCLLDEYRKRIDFFKHPPSNG